MSVRAPRFSPKKTEGNSIFNPRARIEAMYKSNEWVEYSRKFLSYNPKCYSCGENSQATDHIIAHKGDENLFWKLDNLMPLCHRCHNTITNKFDKFKQDLDGKLQWVARNRMKNGIMFPVKVVPK